MVASKERKDKEERFDSSYYTEANFQEFLADYDPFGLYLIEKVTKKSLHNCFDSIQFSEKIWWSELPAGVGIN